MSTALEKSLSRWTAEYESKGLPSSFRQGPSGSVRDFLELALRTGIDPQCGGAVDIGCGTGRNSLYLAEHGFHVYAIDMVPNLIFELGNKADDAGLASRLHSICGDVCEPWPIASGAATLAIDTFCYKHLMDTGKRLAYRQELARVLKPSSLYLLTLASTEDGYYGVLTHRKIDAGMRAITDPANGIESVLYERPAIERCFMNEFDVLTYVEKRKSGPMHGIDYQRVTHVFVMRRL